MARYSHLRISQASCARLAAADRRAHFPAENDSTDSRGYDIQLVIKYRERAWRLSLRRILFFDFTAKK